MNIDTNIIKRAEEAIDFLTDNCPDSIGLKRLIPCCEIDNCLDCWIFAIDDYYREIDLIFK